MQRQKPAQYHGNSNQDDNESRGPHNAYNNQAEEYQIPLAIEPSNNTGPHSNGNLDELQPGMTNLQVMPMDHT